MEKHVKKTLQGVKLTQSILHFRYKSPNCQSCESTCDSEQTSGELQLEIK